MEFNERLQELRKRRGLTQEQLAAALYVSRAAVSKWESGRGYPGIDSLKAIANFFSVTIDELLTGEEALAAAEEDYKEKTHCLQNTVFGLLDLSVSMLLFLPFFGQQSGSAVSAVPLLMLEGIPAYLQIAYIIVVVAAIVSGVLALVLQNCRCRFWLNNRAPLSLVFTAAGALVFILSRQSYAAALLFVCTVIKLAVLVKKH